MSYPLAKIPGSPGGVTTYCTHCRNAIVIPQWYDLNGFLVECPRCHRFHGKHWTAARIVMAATIFGPITLFFLLRPAAAMRMFALWVALWFVAAPLYTAFDPPNAAVEMLCLIVPYLLPLGVAIYEVRRHEKDLREGRVYEAVARW
ncbi:MAG TPA: hypothetical protein VF911_11775 [Thermoanaerobaculia bacterium]|jgi:hypothetical protein